MVPSPEDRAAFKLDLRVLLHLIKPREIRHENAVQFTLIVDRMDGALSEPETLASWRTNYCSFFFGGYRHAYTSVVMASTAVDNLTIGLSFLNHSARADGYDLTVSLVSSDAPVEENCYLL